MAIDARAGHGPHLAALPQPLDQRRRRQAQLTFPCQMGVDLALAGVDHGNQQPGTGAAGLLLQVQRQRLQRGHQIQWQIEGQRQPLGQRQPDPQAGEAARASAAGDARQPGQRHAGAGQDLVAEGEKVGGVALPGALAPTQTYAGR